MTRLTDGKRTVEITMRTWDGSGYGPDWSNDCFNISALEYDEEKEAYKVVDVEYCIDWAKSWENGTMEGEDEVSEDELSNRAVWIEEV